METAIPEPGPRVVVAGDASRPCLQCGYDLRGRADAGHCPECGFSASQSALADRGLRYAPRPWLASIAWGARTALLAVLVTWLLPYLPVWPSMEVEPIGTTCLFAAGVWLLTRPQCRFAPRPSVPRLGARFSAMVPILPPLAGFVPHRPHVLNLFIASTVLWWLAALGLLLLHLRQLAKHVPAPHLARCCAIGAGAFVLAAAAGLLDDALGLSPRAGLELLSAAAALWGLVTSAGVLAAFAIMPASGHRAPAPDDQPPSPSRPSAACHGHDE